MQLIAFVFVAFAAVAGESLGVLIVVTLSFGLVEFGVTLETLAALVTFKTASELVLVASVLKTSVLETSVFNTSVFQASDVMFGVMSVIF